LVLNPLKQDVRDKPYAIFVQLLFGAHPHFSFNFTQIRIIRVQAMKAYEKWRYVAIYSYARHYMQEVGWTPVPIRTL